MPLQPTDKSIVREPFSWLFRAQFADNKTIEQDPDDICITRSDGSGSAFTDVLEYSKSAPLTSFGLQHVSNEEYVWVDMKTGIFVVNDTPIALHNQNFEPQNYKLEIVYFREQRVEQTIGARAQVLSTRHFTNRYFIGWRTMVNGKNKQVTLAVG